MKKLLGILATTGIVTTTSFSVLACRTIPFDFNGLIKLEFSFIEAQEVKINVGSPVEGFTLLSKSSAGDKSILEVSFGEIGIDGEVIITVRPKSQPKYDEMEVLETIIINYSKNEQTSLKIQEIEVKVKAQKINNYELEFSNTLSKQILINIGNPIEGATLLSKSSAGDKSILEVSFGEIETNGDVLVTVEPKSQPEPDEQDIFETLEINYENDENVNFSSSKIEVKVKAQKINYYELEFLNTAEKEIKINVGSPVEGFTLLSKSSAGDKSILEVSFGEIGIDGEVIVKVRPKSQPEPDEQDIFETLEINYVNGNQKKLSISNIEVKVNKKILTNNYNLEFLNTAEKEIKINVGPINEESILVKESLENNSNFDVSFGNIEDNGDVLVKVQPKAAVKTSKENIVFNYINKDKEILSISNIEVKFISGELQFSSPEEKTVRINVKIPSGGEGSKGTLTIECVGIPASYYQMIQGSISWDGYVNVRVRLKDLPDTNQGTIYFKYVYNSITTSTSRVDVRIN